MTPLVHIKIPVWSQKGWLGPEFVEARDLGGGRFAIECPPRFAYGLAVGDEIELDANLPAGFRVTRHSGNLTIWVFCADDDAVSALAVHAAQLLPRIAAALEGTPNRMLIITVPLGSGWSAIESTMKELVARSPGATWEYANVYEVEDGMTPLGWWNTPPGAR